MSAPLWDADACCPYFQTGACVHTEAWTDDDPLAEYRQQVAEAYDVVSDFDYVDADTAAEATEAEERHRDALLDLLGEIEPCEWCDSSSHDSRLCPEPF
jgi:hypothetical protein